MISLSYVLTGLTLVTSAISVSENQPFDEAPNNQTLSIPKRFIVEFNENVNAADAANELARVSGKKVVKVYDSDVFRGCSLESDEDNSDSLQSLNPVSQVWPSRKYQLAPITPSVVLTDEAIITNYSIHAMTGVDKIHGAGITGKGAQVAIVDTGISYDHPTLGGGFGSGFKVAGGYDLVGDGTWPAAGEKEPDDDPLDQQGHGTHVAGIVAGKSDQFTGVAPDATLYSYKVFSTIDGTDEDTLIDAFIRAYDDGADIITCSIGAVNGYTDGPWALVGNRLVERGVLITISAGNSGSIGAFAANSGAAAPNVLAVASAEPLTIAVPTFNITYIDGAAANSSWIPYSAVEPWDQSQVKNWPIYPLSLEPLENDACSPLPENTPDLGGKVVLVRRGGCAFADKQISLLPFNASHILFYSNDQPLTSPSTPIWDSVVGMISAENGKAIIDTIKAGGNVTADFSHRADLHYAGMENTDLPGLASSFTSIGPTNELFIKSDITAPGGRILSTYLNGGFAILSGTSMACPYAAGVAALYVSKYGGRKTQGPKWAKSLAMRIIASGDAIQWDDGLLTGNVYDFFAPVAQVGTGLINATKILDYKTSLSFAKFALNDTHHFSRYHNVEITNNGNSPVTYTFTQQAFGGMNTIDTDPSRWGNPQVAWHEYLMVDPQSLTPRVSFPGGTFTVQPGETKKAEFSFMYPEVTDRSKLPVYSGKVLIKGDNNEELGIPYLGLSADLHKDITSIFSYGMGFPTMTSGAANTPIKEKATFSFDLSLEAQDYVKAYARLQHGTRQLRWDIFEDSWTEREWKYPPVVGEAKYVGSATSWVNSARGVAFDPSKDDASQVIALPAKDVARSQTGYRGEDLWWVGTLANGTQIAPGKYKMRFAALVPFGNPFAADNWDVFDTPTFEVTSHKN
ncbi:unnamed protein product [Clonostachys rhizophaga]|uniref:Minor extracellular protease vpr n=1 Tax=Clonostachys rhizophaga TaxID=160324 RepID=A0A9N9YMH1_9HYPO|nr:unnamed protein product [Clonostachys rhizophaga]